MAEETSVLAQDLADVDLRLRNVEAARSALERQLSEERERAARAEAALEERLQNLARPKPEPTFYCPSCGQTHPGGKVVQAEHDRAHDLEQQIMGVHDRFPINSLSDTEERHVHRKIGGPASQKSHTTSTGLWNSQTGNARQVLVWDDTLKRFVAGYLNAVDVLEPPQITSFSVTPSGAHPQGQVRAAMIDAAPLATITPVFSMAYQGTVTAASIDILSHTYSSGAPEVNPADYPATVTTPFTSLTGPAINPATVYGNTVTFRLTATVDGVVKTRDETLTFYNDRIWGVSSNAAIDTSGEITTLHDTPGSGGGKELASDRIKTFTVTAGANEYIYYIIRDAWGTPTFTVGGFEGGFSKQADNVSWSNEKGAAENYDVWRSDNHSLGATTVVVT